MLKDVVADRQDPGRAEQEPKLRTNGSHLGGKQGAGTLNGTPLASLAEELGLPCLTERFAVYLKLNMPGGRPHGEDMQLQDILLQHHQRTCSQFQGEGEVIHRVRYSGKQKFRKRKPRADWVWVRRRERLREELQFGHLDGNTVRRLEGLFSVRDDLGKKREVALMEILRLR